MIATVPLSGTGGHADRPMDKQTNRQEALYSFLINHSILQATYSNVSGYSTSMPVVRKKTAMKLYDIKYHLLKIIQNSKLAR